MGTRERVKQFVELDSQEASISPITDSMCKNKSKQNPKTKTLLFYLLKILQRRAARQFTWATVMFCGAGILSASAELGDHSRGGFRVELTGHGIYHALGWKETACHSVTTDRPRAHPGTAGFRSREAVSRQESQPSHGNAALPPLPFCLR